MHTFGWGVYNKEHYIYILNEEENVPYFITNCRKSVLMLIYILFVLNILY